MCLAGQKGGFCQLNYEMHGGGDPVLFLHGFGANNYTWSKICPRISDKKLILLELKGHGRSPKPIDDRYSVHDQADLVYDFIVSHNLRNLVLVGHSFGGGVALAVALKMQSRGEYLSGLILIDSAGYRQKLPSFIQVLKLPFIGWLVSLLPARVQVKNVLKQAYFDKRKITDEAVNAYAEPFKLYGGRYAIRQTAKLLPPPDIDDLEKSYSSIKGKTILIWGREDNIIPLKLAERLNRAISGSELVIVDRCGHVPPEEYPELTAKIISDFLSKI